MRLHLFIALLLGAGYLQAQDAPNNAGWLSAGMRSTASLFSEDGAGLGAGGQFRIQFSNQVNSDWFLDYIIVSNQENVRSEYLHIGWSVLFYPFKKLQYPQSKVQPYILAGHCFDYNRQTVLIDPSISEGRWGSAVQAGLGVHFNLSERFDISLLSQYMIHLTKSLSVEEHNGEYHIHTHRHSALEGHLLTTISLNYKLFKLWKK